MPVTLIGSLATPPSPAQARDFLTDWTASLPARLEWFRDEVPDHLAGLRLDELDALFEVVHERRRDPRDVAHPPLWWPGRLGDAFTGYGAALVDGLTAAVAAIYADRVGAVWAIGPDPDDPYYRQPVLTGVRTPPWRQVLSSLAHRDKGRPAGLQQAVELALAAAPAAEPAAAPVTADVEPAGLADWDVRVSLTEGAAEALGHAAYAALEDRLAALPGVVAAMAEDREEFLLRTDPRLDRTTLAEAVQALLRSP
jgi:hypothetical protein